MDKQDLLNECYILLRDTNKEYKDQLEYSYSKAIRTIEKEKLLLQKGIIEIRTSSPFLILDDNGKDSVNRFIASNDPISPKNGDSLNIRSIEQIQYLDHGRNLYYLTRTNLLYSSLIKSRPYMWSVWGNKLYFYPFPDQEYDFRLFYNYSPIDSYQDNYYDLVLYLTMMYVTSLYLNDQDEAAKYVALYAKELNKHKIDQEFEIDSNCIRSDPFL